MAFVWTLVCFSMVVSFLPFFNICIPYFTIVEVRLPYDPVYWWNGWWVSHPVGRSVCHNFLEDQEVSLPCSYQSTYFTIFNLLMLPYSSYVFRLIVPVLIYANLIIWLTFALPLHPPPPPPASSSRAALGSSTGCPLNLCPISCCDINQPIAQGTGDRLYICTQRE